MRNLVVIVILCAFFVAWGAEEQNTVKKPSSFYELKLDGAHGILKPRWMNELRLADRTLYRFGDFEKMLFDRLENVGEITDNPRQMDVRKNLLGSVANTGYLGDLPPDTVYQPAHEGEAENNEEATTLESANDARRDMMRQSGLGSVANTGQLGDAPSDEVYQGGSPESGGQSAGNARQQAFEEAKKKNARNVMMGQVTNGGWTDNTNDGQYQTNIQPGKKNIQVGEDRLPYLIKQLSTPQNPNKNPAEIQRDIQRQMMKQRVIQTNPYDDL